MSGQGSASCNLCPSGKAGATTCANCLVGEFRAGGTGDGTSCTSCAIGMYQSQTGQGSCLPCVPGKHQNEAEQSSCKDCSADTFTDQTGRAACKDCSTGEESEKGSAKCSKCDAGESGTGDGGTCEVCAKGQYRTSAMDADSCAPCAAGFAQNLEGQASVSFLCSIFFDFSRYWHRLISFFLSFTL